MAYVECVQRWAFYRFHMELPRESLAVLRAHPGQPLAEVFGFPINNHSPEAERHRHAKLCPYNNKVPNCTKDKAIDPLGVCSIYDAPGEAAIICPVRFREK